MNRNGWGISGDDMTDGPLTIRAWTWLPGDDDAHHETPNLPLLVRFPGDHQYREPISWLRKFLEWPLMPPFDLPGK
jgi:hypothetical protein